LFGQGRRDGGTALLRDHEFLDEVQRDEKKA